MLQKVLSLFQSGQIEQARVLCKKLSKSDKKNSDVFVVLGDINKQLGELKASENNYKKAIDIKPDSSLIHTRLAMLFHMQGLFSKAEHSYKQSLNLNANQPATYFNLGSVLQEQDKLEEAEKHYREAIHKKPDYAKAYANLGYILRKKNMLQDAEISYRKALEFEPEIAEIHYNIGGTLLENGKSDEAQKYYEKAIQLNYNYADAWSGLGTVQYHKNLLEEACNSFQRAIKIDSNSIDALHGYANALSALGINDKSMEYLKQVLKIEPNNQIAITSQGFIYISLGEPDEALKCGEKILRQDPKSAKAHVLAASAYEKKGDTQKAYEHIKVFIDMDNPDVDIALVYLLVSKKTDHIDEAIMYAEKLLQISNDISVSNKVLLYFSLGKAYDSICDYSNAFISYRNGNELKNETFDVSKFNSNVDNLIKVFCDDFKESLPSSVAADSSKLIFIVGMPRSGTSLVEQIISSHGGVFGAGELDDINHLARSVAVTNESSQHYSHSILMLDEKKLASMAEKYIKYVSSMSPDALRFTDKMPSNYLHLGLIELLFPQARVIHCMRDPLDTCLSCYFQNFYHSHPYSYDLKNLTRVYAGYRRIMQHWKRVLALPIYEVNYEYLVKNQELITREIIEFCDLPWDENCLHFHNSKRLIWTASYDQVRQPMYTNSVRRWKNYADYIEPLKELLKS